MSGRPSAQADTGSWITAESQTLVQSRPRLVPEREAPSLAVAAATGRLIVRGSQGQHFDNLLRVGRPEECAGNAGADNGVEGLAALYDLAHNLQHAIFGPSPVLKAAARMPGGGGVIDHMRQQACPIAQQSLPLVFLDVGPQRRPVGLRLAGGVQALAADQRLVDQVDRVLRSPTVISRSGPSPGPPSGRRWPDRRLTTARPVSPPPAIATASSRPMRCRACRDALPVHPDQPEQQFQRPVPLRLTEACEQIVGAAGEDAGEPAVIGEQPAAEAVVRRAAATASAARFRPAAARPARPAPRPPSAP